MKEEAESAAPSTQPRSLPGSSPQSHMIVPWRQAECQAGKTEVALALSAGQEGLTCLTLVPALLSSPELVFREKKDMLIQRVFFFFFFV